MLCCDSEHEKATFSDTTAPLFLGLALRSPNRSEGVKIMSLFFLGIVENAVAGENGAALP